MCSFKLLPTSTHKYPWQLGELPWREAQRFLPQDVPDKLQPWLSNTDSFTAAMRAVCGNNLIVKVINQSWQPPQRSEAQFLDIPPSQVVLIREVEMWGNEQLWLVARSVFPRSTITGKEYRLQQLGTQPLGEVLFTDPLLQRGPFEWVNVSSIKQWGRRSLFYIHDKPLLVSEFLCPDLPDFPDSANLSDVSGFASLPDLPDSENLSDVSGFASLPDFPDSEGLLDVSDSANFTEKLIIQKNIPN